MTGASPNWVLVPKELSTGNPIYSYQNPPAAETWRIFIAPDSPAAKVPGARESRLFGGGFPGPTVLARQIEDGFF